MPMWVSARCAILRGLLICRSALAGSAQVFGRRPQATTAKKTCSHSSFIGTEDFFVTPGATEHDIGPICADGGVEGGVVLARADHHGHGHGVAEDQRLLAR